MYLKLDLIILAVAVAWFFIGLHVFHRVPLIRDPMIVFSRRHSRVAPFVVFLLVVFWPVSKLVWRSVNYCVCKFDRIRRSKTK